MRKQLPGGIELRELASDEEYEAVVDLERETWGVGFEDTVPTTILMISQKMSGVLAGAFDRDGRMLGFIYGLSGFRYGKRAHWSHMLAVTREARGLGLGRELKVFQREILLPLGVETVYWTYDPLVARNANLNLNRLGALPVEYVVNMYGEDTGSVLHSGLGTDRFVVAWPILSSRVDWLINGEPAATPTRAAAPFPVDESLPETAWIEVPPNIGRILHSSPENASAWRRRTRAQFQEHLEAGYAVTGFTWREDPESDAGEGAGAPSGADAGGDAGAPSGTDASGGAGTASVLNRRYYYRLEKLEGTETQ
jgi:predicted GNAT superfamily acetyltransferase